jgi:DnaJ like chaperone protein
MSIWDRIIEAIENLVAGSGLSDLFTSRSKAPEKTVAFTIAVIALSAKMAKADGHVTRNEVSAFREIFSIEASEEANAARIYNLARSDVAGYEHYAKSIAGMFDEDKAILTDLLEGLFYIASADGDYHPAEDAFLKTVAGIFEVNARDFNRIRATFAPDFAPDPYVILGVDHDAQLADIRAAWRALVKANHPDLLMARGVPQEAITLANRRLDAINTAWDAIKESHAA